MTSLTNLPTKCRFAVLEVSDDEDEEKPQLVGDKAGSAKCADGGNSAGKAKKKRKKKKSRAKSNQSSEVTLKNEEESDDKEPSVQTEEWGDWIQKDEQYVLSQFQRDLKAALEASKQDAWQARQKEEALEASKQDAWQARQKEELIITMETSLEDGKGKKKKEKSVVMSLDEFQLTGSTEGTINSAKFEEHSVTRLDDFLDWPDDSTAATRGSHENSKGTAHNEIVQVESHNEEKPEAGKSVKHSSRKKASVRCNKEGRSQDYTAQLTTEKKLLPATHEDQIQAEMVHIKEKLQNTSHELSELKKTENEHIKIIEDLKKELLQVKKRNKQLCFILSQAEMKEKSELLMQIEELNEVKEQVVQLHVELEQERSKNSALKSEIAKSLGGRQRHGSCS